MSISSTKNPQSLIVSCSDQIKNSLKEYVQANGATLDSYKALELSSKIIQDKKHVALIGGGMSSEKDVSYMSCNGIFRSLLELGYQVTFIDMGRDIAEVLAYIKPDVVFNGLHGVYGEDGCLPGLLNIMGIPYTGSGVLPSSIAFNKKVSLDIFKSNEIHIAESVLLSKESEIRGDPLPRPYVIKPLSQGSSIGIIIIFENSDFDFNKYDFPHGAVIVEKYIKGREIQVGILNGKAMGTLEIKLLQGKVYYDYETKYTEGFAEHLCPAPLSADQERQVLKIAEKAAKILNVEGLVRVELIFDEDNNKFYILELNTHTGMTPLSICTEIAWKQQQISYTELVSKMLESAKCD